MSMIRQTTTRGEHVPDPGLTPSPVQPAHPAARPDLVRPRRPGTPCTGPGPIVLPLVTARCWAPGGAAGPCRSQTRRGRSSRTPHRSGRPTCPAPPPAVTDRVNGAARRTRPDLATSRPWRSSPRPVAPARPGTVGMQFDGPGPHPLHHHRGGHQIGPVRNRSPSRPTCTGAADPLQPGGDAGRPPPGRRGRRFPCRCPVRG